ncbi:MAG TPA: hypothetical protein VFJ88_04970 [Chthoniobacterales bacterium]|jgi:uncharacterized membrane protein YeaQ/YmgE (transglycosylase-associated protein family)|nr:hypothetical protein [Chthoniobacterales bacterium]
MGFFERKIRSQPGKVRKVLLARMGGLWSNEGVTTDSGLTKPETENSLYLGAIATAVVGLLPYINVFLLPAYVIGAMVAVWHAATRRRQAVSFKEGAKLGFLSTFFGSMVAVVLADLIWLFFDYQLWQHQNAQLLLAIVGSFAGPVTIDTMRDAFAQQEVKPFQWYLFFFQLLGNAILSGLFGVPAGLLAAKIFRPRAESLGQTPA